MLWLRARTDPQSGRGQSRTSGDGPKMLPTHGAGSREAVAAKEVQPFRDTVVDANIEIVIVE